MELAQQLRQARNAIAFEERLAFQQVKRAIAGTDDKKGVAPTDPVKVGRYELRQRIGAGGGGVVYRGFDPKLSRSVAIKLLPSAQPQHERRLRREALALACLAHPNVVAVYDAGEFNRPIDPTGDQHHKGVYIVMEYVRGTTLEQSLHAANRGRRQALNWVLDAGHGLLAAHRAGLVHRDFKPQNILIGDDGRARVVDLGLARWCTSPVQLPPTSVASIRPTEVSVSPSLHSPITAHGAIVGTPNYMAPEQRTGSNHVDSRGDQYAFCLVYLDAWLIENRDGPSLGQRVRWATCPQLLDEALHACGLPPTVFQALRRGLAADPALRWPTLEPLLFRLRQPQDHRPVRRAKLRPLALASLAALMFRPASAPPAADQPTTSALVLESSASPKEQARAVDSQALTDADRLLADGQVREAETRLRTAFWQAARANEPQAADIAAKLTQIIAKQDHRRREGLDWARHAEVLVSRADIDAHERARRNIQVGAAFANQGDHQRAAVVYGRASAWLTQNVPASDPDRFAAKLGQAHAYYQQTQLDQAKRTFLTLLEEQQRLANPRPARIARVLTRLGVIERQIGTLDQAAAWLIEAIDLLETSLGGSHPSLATAIQSLAIVRYKQGLLAEAFAGHQRALAMRQATLGPDHPEIATCYANLGAVAAEQGHALEAMNFRRRALAITEQALGPQHPFVGGRLLHLGDSMIAGGDTRNAQRLFERAQGVYDNSLTNDHPHRALPAMALGNLWLSQGQPDKALDYFEQARSHYAIAQHSNGVASAKFGMARAWWLMQRPREAISAAFQARDVYEQTGSENLLAQVDTWLSTRTI